MSKNLAASTSVLVWSPGEVAWIDSEHRLVSAGSLQEAAGLLPSRDVTVALSGRCTFVRAVRVPNAPKADVLRILRVQVGQIFPIPANELSFDAHLTQDVNSEGRLAVVCAVRSSDLLDLQNKAKAAGLKVSRVVPASLASPLLAKSLGMEDAAVVHRTAEGISIDLVAGGELRYARVAATPNSAIGIEAEVARTFAAAVLHCSPTIAAGGLVLPDAEASAATWGVEMLSGAHLDVNIMTPEQLATLERAGERQRIRAAVLVLGVALIFFVFQFQSYMRAMTAAQSGAEKWKKTANTLTKLKDAETAKAESVAKLKTAIERGFSPRQTLGDALTVVTNDAPKGIWLTAISAERGKPIMLRGTATSGGLVVDYQNALLADNRFRDVKLLFANNTQIENTPVVQFSLSAFPIGNLPLVDPNAKKGGN